jgi:hypothetical protein
VLAPANAVARESELHDDILSDCKNRGWLVVHSRMDMRTTTAVGVPDFVIMGDRGRVWWIECKSCGGKLTPEQQAFHAMAKNLGHEVHTVWNFTKYYAIVTGQMVEGGRMSDDL